MSGTLQTTAALLAWVAQEQARHQRVTDQRCTCGWEEPTGQAHWPQHQEVAIIGNLLDHLPSNTWESDGERSVLVPAGRLITDLYATIDQRHKDEAKLAQALQEIARGTEDPKGRAQAALNDWYHDEE